jgi:branched-chain amino acid transport system ATP-binding protein
MLEVSGLRHSFGGVIALDGANFSVPPDALVALVGPNGAGKTTLIDVVTGFIRPSSGGVYFAGRDISRQAPEDIARAGLVRLFQEVRVFSRMTVLDNLLFGYMDQRRETFLGAMFGWGATSEERKQAHGAETYLRSVHLWGRQLALGGELSHGQQKSVGIGRMLATGARMLVLDEPTAGLDPAKIEELLELIRQLRVDGLAVLMVEHNLDVVRELADLVVFMDSGRVVLQGSPAVVLDDPTVRALYMGV